MSYRALMQISRDAFKALSFFIDAYKGQGGKHAEWLREMESGTRPRTQKELKALRGSHRKPPRVVIDWW